MFVLPLSRIDAPGSRDRLPAGRTTVIGVAWAPPHGVASVHVAVVDLPVGQHELSVRCTSRNAQVQSPERSAPFPDRVQGHHGVTVTAR